MDAAAVIPFSFTHVVYAQGDGLGFVLAAIALTPVFLMVAYTTLLATRPDCATLALVVGQLVNEVLNWVLKHTIKAARPTLAHPFVPKYGMPSNHAQFMGFAAVYISLWACKRWRVTARAKAALIVAVQAAAAAVMVSRVYLVYHSVEQVLVGYAVGAAAACTWFALVETVARPRFRTVAASAWARALRLRDCTHCAHVLQVEYAATLAAAEAAAKSAAAATSGSNMKRE